MKDNIFRDVCILTHIVFLVELISNVDLFYKMTSNDPMIPYVIGTYLISFYISFITIFFVCLIKFIIDIIIEI